MRRRVPEDRECSGEQVTRRRPLFLVGCAFHQWPRWTEGPVHEVDTGFAGQAGICVVDLHLDFLKGAEDGRAYEC